MHTGNLQGYVIRNLEDRISWDSRVRGQPPSDSYDGVSRGIRVYVLAEFHTTQADESRVGAAIDQTSLTRTACSVKNDRLDNYPVAWLEIINLITDVRNNATILMANDDRGTFASHRMRCCRDQESTLKIFVKIYICMLVMKLTRCVGIHLSRRFPQKPVSAVLLVSLVILEVCHQWRNN